MHQLRDFLVEIVVVEDGDITIVVAYGNVFVLFAIGDTSGLSVDRCRTEGGGG